MSLFNKHRPATLDDIYGNQKAVDGIRTLLQSKDSPHAWMLSGPYGCGKTSTARIIAQELGCTDPMDLTEHDAAQFAGIDYVREIKQHASLAPMASKARAWIIDECHRLSAQAFDGMLKLLEDPPASSYFILCTTEPDKVPKTVRSRCQQFQVEPLGEPDMLRLLRSVCKREGASVPRDVLEQIARDSLGSSRDALVVLEQIVGLPEEKMKEAAVRVAAKQNAVVDLCRSLMTPRQGWQVVAQILIGLEKEDPESIRRAVRGYCTAILLRERNARAFLVSQEFDKPLFSEGRPELVAMCWRAMDVVRDAKDEKEKAPF